MTTSLINRCLEGSLRPGEGRLIDAMRYALLGEGKRIRPRLTLSMAHACAPSFGEDEIIARAMPAAMAVEYVHAYSLIHDDLPALDNDDMRRGKPSCHKQFDEATAILAGDALLSDAFGLLSSIEQCQELSTCIGSRGMVRGQMQDILKMGLDTNKLKTAKLFEAACVLGALSVDATKEQIILARRYGSAYGLAFQLADDCADGQGDGGLIAEHVHVAIAAAKDLSSEDLSLHAQRLLDYLKM